MFTKVFSTATLQTHSSFSRWQKKTSGCDTRMEAVYSEEYTGICGGIALAWLKKSISSNNGVHSSDELGSPHLMAIVSGASNKKSIPGHQGAVTLLQHDVALLASQGLSPGESLYGRTNFDPVATSLWIAKHEGHCIVTVSNTKIFHVMGGRSQNGVYDFFDPSHGLFRSSNMNDFVMGTLEHLYTYYYSKGCASGKWLILQVKP